MDREALGAHARPFQLAALIRWLAAAAALAAVLLLAASGPGARFGAWSWQTGFVLFRWSAYAGIAAALAAALALAVPSLRRRGIALPVVALVVGFAVFYVPFQLQREARSAPPINDITTDPDNPPRYMTGERAYPGAEFARRQREAYPDIAPVLLAAPRREAFARAVAAAQAMGWEVVGHDEAAGTIEAVDTTKWFGFKDDIAIRVSAQPGGVSPPLTRVDIRSKSRVGRGDLGTNAQRVRAYAERLK